MTWRRDPDDSPADALAEAVLGPAGISDPAWRRAGLERSAAIARGISAAEVGAVGSMPQPLAALVDDIARHAYRVTDEQFDSLRAEGFSADVLFEITVAAATGAGLQRRSIGLEAIAEWESQAAAADRRRDG